MHLPEKWGMLQFSDAAVNTTAPIRNPQWTVRSVAMALYYAQHAYADAHNGTFTEDVAALYVFAPPHTLDGTCSQPPRVKVAPGGATFVAEVPALTGSMVASVTDDRYLTVTGN